MVIVAWVAASVVVLMLVAAPLVIRRTTRMSADPTVRLLEPVDVPDDVAVELDTGGRAWSELGLEVLGDVVVQGHVAGVTSYRRVLADVDRTTVAAVAVDNEDRREDQRTVTMLVGSRVARPERGSEFAWDEVSVSDLALPQLPFPDGTRHEALPGATARQLLAVHRVLLAEVEGSERLLALTDLIDDTHEDVARLMSELRRQGVLEPDGEGELRFTLSGAYRATTPNLPGVLQVGRMLRRRRARSRLAQLVDGRSR